MNKIIVFIISTLFSVSAFAATDYACMGQCTASGSSVQICEQQCERDPQPLNNLTPVPDPYCIQTCKNQGYSYPQCVNICTK